MPTLATRSAVENAQDNDGENASGSFSLRAAVVRPSPVRRAGSSQIASNRSRSASSALPCATVTVSRDRRLYAASAAVTGSASIASTRVAPPIPASAIESAPRPQPRSPTMSGSPTSMRRAWCAATDRRVACARPSRVKSIRSAKGPNFATASCRSWAWRSISAASAGSIPSFRSRVAIASSCEGL